MDKIVLQRIERTQDQRLAALLHANEIRVARAALKKRLAREPLHVLDVLADPPPFARAMKMGNILNAMPGLGPTRVQQIQRTVRFSFSKTLVGLSDRQRSEISALLAERYAA